MEKKGHDDSRARADSDQLENRPEAQAAEATSDTAAVRQRRASLSGPAPEPSAASSKSAVKSAYVKPLEVAVHRMKQMSVGVVDPTTSPSASSREDDPPLRLGELRPDYTLGRPTEEGAAGAADTANAASPQAANGEQQNSFVRAIRNGYKYFKDVLRNNKRYQILANCYTGIVMLQFLQFAVILLFYGSFTRSSDDSENVASYLQATTVYCLAILNAIFSNVSMDWQCKFICI